MRTPYATPGRNTWIENTWQRLTNYIRVDILGRRRTPKYSTPDSITIQSRNYDLEIQENVVRDSDGKAKLLVWCYENNSIVKQSIGRINDQVWASNDGDDRGFTIAETLDDNITPIDPRVYEVCSRLRKDILTNDALDTMARRMVAYGDWFCSIGIDWKNRRIERILPLPTWEVFRVEDNQGQLLGFEQRRYLSDPDPVQMHPILCMHGRFQVEGLYGRGLFYEAIKDCLRLERVLDNLDNGANAIGLNPRIHQMPCGMEDDEVIAYKEAYEARLREKGIVTDFFPSNGIIIKNLSESSPDLSALLAYKESLIRDIARSSRLPLWLLGIDTPGAQKWQGGPERAMGVFLNSVRGSMSSCLRHAFNLELALAGFSKDEWLYRFTWPRFVISGVEEKTQLEPGEMNKLNIEDLDYFSSQSDRAIQATIRSIEIEGKKGLVLTGAS